jgi:hypothetical protein
LLGDLARKLGAGPCKNMDVGVNSWHGAPRRKRLLSTAVLAGNQLSG